MIKSDEPLCFLHMKNKNEGYYLKCNHFDASNNNLLTFSCYSCTRHKELWNATCLFSFSIPIPYLLGESEQRVYESIYPFLPNYDHAGSIYFVHYDNEQQLSLLNTYDIKSGVTALSSVQMRTHNEVKGFMAPFILENSLCCGLIATSPQTIRMTLNLDEETGIFNLDLPILPLDDK